jgi:hypothetical protein
LGRSACILSPDFELEICQQFANMNMPSYSTEYCVIDSCSRLGSNCSHTLYQHTLIVDAFVLAVEDLNLRKAGEGEIKLQAVKMPRDCIDPPPSTPISLTLSEVGRVNYNSIIGSGDMLQCGSQNQRFNSAPTDCHDASQPSSICSVLPELNTSPSLLRQWHKWFSVRCIRFAFGSYCCRDFLLTSRNIPAKDCSVE